MIETEITIITYRKSDIDIVTQKVCERKMQLPVFILEYENHYKIKISSDYEEWELDAAIKECFPEYEFTTDLGNGGEEIRVQISRYQSECSTDKWGRPIENPLDEVKYLIKRRTKTKERFSPRIKVLFGNSIQDYYINIVNGINTISGEKGFLLLDYFKQKAEDGVSAEILKDRLHKSPIDAFHSGFSKLQNIVNNDFKNYQKQQTKKIAEEQRIPRKIIREFIKSCNSSDIDGMIKNLAKKVVYINKLDWQKELRIEGKKEFVNHIKSTSQDLCAQNFIIRSQWIFRLDNISIGVKFFPKLGDGTKDNSLQYQRFTFVLGDNKIQTIWHEK